VSSVSKRKRSTSAAIVSSCTRQWQTTGVSPRKNAGSESLSRVQGACMRAFVYMRIHVYVCKSRQERVPPSAVPARAQSRQERSPAKSAVPPRAQCVCGRGVHVCMCMLAYTHTCLKRISQQQWCMYVCMYTCQGVLAHKNARRVIVCMYVS
jgi:hypothetical protein